ncbi:MAG: BREX system P-loop protein BrxC, partial [Planctomycetes bacterium]|nr:BREX system P-loop protein BrxC [Planctomycetota bacterium]
TAAVRIGDLFATPVEDKIEPVIKVGERDDERKLAAEIGSYVVTPLIEQYLDDLLEHYTDTFLQRTTEIGTWISGYFGSGKSHFAKIASLLVSNPMLAGVPAAKRFESRLQSDAPRRGSILRSLSRIDQCETGVLAFNLNTLADSRSRPLASLLLSQYYLSRGYSGNLLYARVIEAELDRQGKLERLHRAVESRAGRAWPDIQKNLSFYRSHLYAAACEVAPDVFPSSDSVDRALREAESGELHNVRFLVDTILSDMEQRQAERKKAQRLLFVLDESGQWIEDDSSRLSQLQALVEDAALRGQGRIWIVVTTHGDMGSIYKEARALDSDFKKIEGRFRFKPALTTENIELVLEDRLFRKSIAGHDAVEELYERRGGVIRGLGEPANVASRTLPACTKEKFATYYPFFPWQVHVVPEIVKSLRSKGGRGEQMSGSTRTLLAITQDILRAGRRRYLQESLGELVSFDELYANLAGEGEISPDVRTELLRLKDTVPGATPLTTRVAEVLYLIRELSFIPRTRDNIARLLVESADDDLPAVLARIDPELERLIAAGLVAPIGEEFEFLTGEKRTFEEEVTTTEQQYMLQDRERGLRDNFIQESGKTPWRRWLDSDVVSYRDHEFHFKLMVDDHPVTGTKGDVTLKLYTPLSVGRVTLADLENRSLRSEDQNTIFFLCGRVNAFDRDLARFLAVKEVIGNWKGDPRKSEEARQLAMQRETDDLVKLERRVVEGLKEGLRTGHLVFQGMSRLLGLKPGQTSGGALRGGMAACWPALYPRFEKVPVRITHEQKAIQDVLAGQTDTTRELAALRLFDKAGKVDLHAPLLDAIRIQLATAQKDGKRVHGKDLLETLCGIGYGWDPNAVRVGVAALVRGGNVKLSIGQKEYSNPADRDVVDALRVARNFDRTQLILEEGEVDPEVLTETRKFLMKLARTRNIDETPAALAAAADQLGRDVLAQAEAVRLWTAGSGMPLPAAFSEGHDAWNIVLELTNPVHRVNEIHTRQDTLAVGREAIQRHARFRQQHAILFKDLSDFVAHLEAVEHRLDAASPLAKLLGDYRAARAAASFAESDVWNALESRKAQAQLELAPVLDSWRCEARGILDQVLERLPGELAERQLDATLESNLAQPLRNLREQLDSATLPAQVAAFPDQARQLVVQLGRRIAEHAARRAQTTTGSGTTPGEGARPSRQVCTVRMTDVATVTRVSTLDEWQQLNRKLDEHVCRLLGGGCDVELR